MAFPGRHAFLGLADQHHPSPARPRRGLLIRACDVFLALALAEAHDRHVMRGDERIQLLDQTTMVVLQPGRRRQPVTAVEQEPDQAALVGQSFDVAGHADPIHRRKLEGDVLIQKFRHALHDGLLPLRSRPQQQRPRPSCSRDSRESHHAIRIN